MESKRKTLQVISATKTKDLRSLFEESNITREEVVTIIKDGEYFRLFYVK